MKTAKMLMLALVTTTLVVGGCARHHGYGTGSSYREAALERGLAETDELVDRTVKDPEKAKQANVTNTPKTLEGDRKKVRDALATIKDFPALTSADGKITIVDIVNGKHAGDAIKKGTLIQVQNGKFVPVGEGKAAALKVR